MEKNKTKIVSIMAIIALVLTLVTATYAYFQAQTGEGSQADVKINANTVDTLTFETGSAINLSLDQENFAQGTGNQTGSTFAKAMLTANNKTNTATEHYYMYLNISENTFTYTQNEETPEILLTITDTNNNEITSITGLTYKTITDGNGTTLKGFDITNQKGLITIFDNKEITTTTSITEEWNVTVTYVNYNEDQSANAGKSFSAKLMIQKNQIITNIANVCETGNNLKSCLNTLGSDGTLEFTNLYYHDSSLANGAGDNSYRYAGPSKKVNNFVCFGSTESPCPTDNLYRIIGVIDEKVKLIKYDFANSNLLGEDGDYQGQILSNQTYYEGSLTTINTYLWNHNANPSSYDNTWSTSLLNKTNLNTNYLNNIGTTWSNLIEDATWKVSGNSTSSVTPSEMYTAEITNATKTYGPSDGTSKIGLVYASDYGFAASPSAWTSTLYNYDGNDANGTSIKTINWMYMGLSEWTITRKVDGFPSAFVITMSGNISSNGVNYAFIIRPSFYLEPSITYVSGTGTQSDPIILS